MCSSDLSGANLFFYFILINTNDLYYRCSFYFRFFCLHDSLSLPGAPNAQQSLIVFSKHLWNSSMVCKLSVMTCQTSMNLLDNIYIIFLQHLCKNFEVQGSNLRISRTEPAGPVLQGPVQGSAVCLNRTISYESSKN